MGPVHDVGVLGVGSLVEIRCHPNCPWAAGWEVCQLVASTDGPRFVVRRVGLPRPLSSSLPAEDVRLARAPALGRTG
jgi:hypothetical protein